MKAAELFGYGPVAAICLAMSLVATLFALAAARGDGAQAAGEAPPPGRAPTNAQIRVHAFVSGRVQGVGFRNYTQTSARTLRLTGWVRNLDDGRVECVVEGPRPEVEKLTALLSKGPGGARVEKVEREEAPFTGEFARFEVRP